MDSPAKPPTVNDSPDDYYSIFRFRFWRSLALVAHGAFLHHLFKVLDLEAAGGGGTCFGTTVLAAILISAATLGVFRQIARILCFIDGRPFLQALHTVSAFIIHEIIVEQLEGNRQALLLLPLQTLCFICYLRSVVPRGGDPSKTICLLSQGSALYAGHFYRKDGLSSVSVYFFVVGFLGIFAKNTDRGFRAPNAGLFDRFLDILG